ncbi:MAG TPA: hypothetical protein DIW47_04260 [Bacteroidetes bacterium]|nr:hypothetical protein [Bacteroidota bacterium]
MKSFKFVRENQMMKKITVFFCTLFFGSLLYAQIPTNGLIAYYPFTGNANDSSGNSNNGTVNGAILTTDRFGDSNRAYLFNGSSSYIEVPNSSSLQSPTSEVTISAWVQITNLAVLNWIIDKRINVGSSPYSSYGIFTANSEWRTGISTSNAIVSTGKTAIVQNNWIHVLTLYTGSKIYLYLDGVAVDSANLSGNILYSTLPLYIGKSPNNAAYTAGKIDDIRIYDRALNATEIGQLYNEAQNTTSLMPMTEHLFQIYPNPSSGSVNIQVIDGAFQEGYEVTVTNSIGQVIYHSDRPNGDSVVDLEGIAKSGIYFITLTDQQGYSKHTEKVMLY